MEEREETHLSLDERYVHMQPLISAHVFTSTTLVKIILMNGLTDIVTC